MLSRALRANSLGRSGFPRRAALYHTERAPAAPIPPSEAPAGSTSSDAPKDPPVPLSSPVLELAGDSSGAATSLPALPIHTETRYPELPIPFHTYNFFRSLAKTFPEPVARHFTKIARILVAGRFDQAQRETISKKDLDNEAYLFRAALSETRTEMTMRMRSEVSTLQTTAATLRREVDALESKMKEDIGTLKHEIQMEMNNRKHDRQAETKIAEIAIEETTHRAIINVSETRTFIERAKWDNTRRAVGVIGALVFFIITSMEFGPKRPPPPPPHPPAPLAPPPPPIDIRELEGDSDDDSDIIPR